jgi:hypothetical protein
MSLYVHGEKNITFLHIPKTAGTSMLDWLIRNVGNSEYVKWDIHPKLSTVLEERNTNFSYTVVRNPWDRMVSMYHYFKNIAINEGSRFLALNNLTADNFPTFESWVMNLDDFKVPEPYWFNAKTPQIDWIDQPIDLVLRYEHLAEDFKQIQALYNCSEPLPHIYYSGRGHYADYYNDTTKQIVAQVSEADIETYRYTF